MARPHGFDHFCAFLKGLEEHYVIIGGGAAAIFMDEQGLDFRATKDVDLVVVSRSQELQDRIRKYVAEGGYQISESTENIPRYYRFKKPTDSNCPTVIEIFASNELGIELHTGQHIIPVSGDSTEKLSAILLDNEYFDLIRQNIVISETGISMINAAANICLKARAHRDLFERKQAGDSSIDERDIQKHLRDIWRIAASLTGEENLTLSGTPMTDIAAAISKLDGLTDTQFKQVMEKTPGLKKETVMNTLKKVYLRPD